MDEPDDILPPLEAFVDSLLGWAAVSKQILDHMEASQAATGRLTPTIPEVLATLLLGTLEPMDASRSFELGVAARVLSDATDVVTQEIVMVPISEFAPRNRAERRARRRRGA